MSKLWQRSLLLLAGSALVAGSLAASADGEPPTGTVLDSEARATITEALRPLGAGTADSETMFFLLVLAGRVFGPGFGFALGCTSLFASALLTGGVGPWMPYQMFGCAFVGMFAGILPKARGRTELAMLAVYAARARS